MEIIINYITNNIIYSLIKFKRKMPQHTSDTEEDDIDFSSLPKRSQTARNRKVPLRLGVSDKDVHALEEVLSAEEVGDLSADEETDYVPPAKRQRANSNRNTHFGLDSANLHGENHGAQSSSTTNDSNGNDFDRYFVELSDQNASVIAEGNGDSQHLPESVDLCQNADETNLVHVSVLEKLNEKIDNIQDKLNEILSRYHIMESILIRNEKLPLHEEPNLASPVNSFAETFITSNSLPVKNKDDLNAFHGKLEEQKFREKAVCKLYPFKKYFIIIVNFNILSS